ncbi:MAG TPA: NADH-quinone oxidoreductase subunit L [Acidimicrobiales bacterium]|nr:NADH-quinone oxidoreductase subunit L [Acidimicrobiales bacterium]
MLHAAYLMPLLPLAGFVLLVFAGRRFGDPVAGWIGTVAVAGSFVVACLVLGGMAGLPVGQRLFVHNYFTWFHVGGLTVPVGIHVDPLSVTMCMFITGVSALIHLYSVGYMKGDPDYAKFFIYLNLFVFSMLVLVLANNLVLTFVGWEGVGVCSYWLIAFWFHRDSAASAGKKAFIYNRIGDAGFLLAIFLIYEKTGTLQYTGGPGGGIFGQLHHIGGGTATAAVLLLFLAATGKSAQIPLFNWLPDAMEGPTPVSALIHAATMVTAGVYLLCRMNHLLALSGNGTEVVAIIGGVTAFVAATIACAQQDIKKVLAFSTISQIGYMILAAGSGAYAAAIFLMVAHAFFKGLLFLAAGSVIHGLHGEQDLKRMGALRKYMKWTTWTFTIGWLAIAGVPPLAGFWAKGNVLENVYSHYKVLWVLGLLTAVLTAYYMSRLQVLAFGGEQRWDKPGPNGEPARHEPHESPWVMRLPLVILAVAALAGGVLNLPWAHRYSLEHWLAPVFAGALYDNHLNSGSLWALALADAAAAVIGIVVAVALWRGREVDKPRFEPQFLQRVWYWDDAYDMVIGRPSQRLATFLAWVVDARIIDGAVNGAARLVRTTGTATRRLQTGYVRNYALGIAIGMAAIVLFLLSRTWWS